MRLLCLLPLSLVLLAGCGGESGRTPGDTGTTTTDTRTPHTLQGVRACLDESDDFKRVENLPSTTGNALPKPDRQIVEDSTRETVQGLTLTSGGPTEHEGTIVEAPVVVDELYLFDDPKDAAAAATLIDNAIAKRPDSALGDAEAVGSATVVRYAYGIGDRPEKAPLNPEALEPIRTCLETAGYA